LDATKYYIIIPDSIGHGKSLNLKTKFPKYDYADMVDAQYRLLTEGLGLHHVRLIIGNSDYADMVDAQYRLLTEGLGLHHVRLIIGNSMGGMHAWLWGEKYPGYMDALVPMASQPTAMASRNWMLRRMMLELIRNDPEYQDGNYTTQPRSLKLANVFFGIATAGGTLNYQKLAPTNEKADQVVDARLAAPMNADANDFIWAWNSSADYDAAPRLESIEASVLAINSADDERNPPESGLEIAALKRVKNGKLYLIPASDETRGHFTTGMARFYSQQLQDLLSTAPKQAM